MKYLIDRASAITPKDSLDDLLKSKKSLRIKLGVDPTAPDVTLGWYAILRALRKFQELWTHCCFNIRRIYCSSWRPFRKVRN